MKRLAGAALAACVLAACSHHDHSADGDAPAAAGSAAPAADPVAVTTEAAVDMPRSYLFRPETLTVRPGTRVTWTNHDVFTHGVTVAGRSLTARPGASVHAEFGQAGVFPYECPFHPQMMKGVIRVTEGS